MSRARSYLFTSFVEDQVEGEIYVDLLKDVKDIKYCILQLEQCPSTSRLHLQGYVCWKNAKTMQASKTILGPSCHLEVRRGSDEDAVTYCSKSDTRIAGPWEWGERLHQGKSSQLLSVCQDIQSGNIQTLEQLISQAPDTYCRNRNGIRDILGNTIKKRTKTFRTLTVEIYYGEAGTGKTRRVYEQEPDLYSMEQSANGSDVWFDGYEGEKTLLIDDFYGWIRFSFILKMLDGYRLKLPVKGSYTWAEWDKVLITSNAAPWDWYRWSNLINWEAFQRRITKVYHFTANNNPQEIILHKNSDCHTNSRGTICTCFQ